QPHRRVVSRVRSAVQTTVRVQNSAPSAERNSDPPPVRIVSPNSPRELNSATNAARRFEFADCTDIGVVAERGCNPHVECLNASAAGCDYRNGVCYASGYRT